MGSQFFEEQDIRDLLDDLQESAYSSSDDLTLDTYCDTNDKPHNVGYNDQFNTLPESCEIEENIENSSSLLTDETSCNSWELRIKTSEEPNSIDIDGPILEAIPLPSKSFSESATIVDNKNSHACIKSSLQNSMDSSLSDISDTAEITKAKDTISKLDQNLRANIMMAFYHLSQTVQTSGIETPLELKNVVGVKEQELLYMMYSHTEEKKTPVATQATFTDEHPAPALAATRHTKKRIHDEEDSNSNTKTSAREPTQPTKIPTRRTRSKQTIKEKLP